MKKKNRTILFIFFLSIIFLYPTSSMCGTERLEIKADIKQIEQGKEILVEKNVSLENPVWCGENAVVVNGGFGVRWIDFVNKKMVTIHTNPYVGAVDCTSDGNWVVYVDTRSSRYDKSTSERLVVDFWRYNLKTRQRQKFAIARGGCKWSPDAKKLLFYGSKPKFFMEQPHPKWELVFSKADWPPGGGFEAKWLADSSSIVLLYRDKLYIEKLDTKDPVKLINIDLGDIMHLKLDKFNIIYLISRSKKDGKKAQLLRCIMKADTLQCEDPLKRNNTISWYGITPDGEQIVFLEKVNKCGWHIKSGDMEPRCAAQQAELVNISPDGKWLVFVRHRKIGEQSGVDVVENDLYVVRLENK